MIDDFHDLLLEMIGSDVKFLVVDAHALSVHGVPRATADLDLWVRPDAGNAARVCKALDAFIRNKRASGRKKDLADLEALGIE